MPRNTSGLHRGPGLGRPKGVPNKATAHAREAIALFVDQNTPKLQAWLDQIAEQDGPLAAFKCVQELIEYHVPKLARTEITGSEGTPLIPPGGIVFRIEQQPGTQNRT